MPEQFDARSYDPYNTNLISDRDLTPHDRESMYDARCEVIHEPSRWPAILFWSALVGLMGWITWPFWQQVSVWMGW